MHRSCVVAGAMLVVVIGAARGVVAQGEALRAQRVETVLLDDVHPVPGDDAVVDLYLRTLGASGDPIDGLSAAGVQVRDGERLVDPDDVSIDQLEALKRGVSVVLALDLSPTMREPFPQVKEAALAFLRKLGGYDRIAVVSFAGSVQDVAAFHDPRAQVENRIQGLQPNSEPAPTRVHDGIHRALELIRLGTAGLPRRAFVVVFSDGDDGGSSRSAEEIVQLAQGGPDQPRVPVFTIGWRTGFGDRGLPVLERIAGETTARFVTAETADGIARFYADVWAQMMKSWVVRAPARLDGELHTVSVVIDAKKDVRGARYPLRAAPVWPWLIGLAVLLASVLAWLILVRRRMATIVFVNGPLASTKLRLRRGTYRIGALSDNEVVLTHETISRRHAEIVVDGRGVEIRDLESTNGIFVNGEAVERAVIHPGDRVRLADLDLVVER